MSNTDNTTPIYGGWGRTPLGYIEGDSTMEITYTDAMFYRDMYSVPSVSTVTTGSDSTIKGGGMYSVTAGPAIVIPYQLNLTDIQIAGFDVQGTGTAATGRPVAAYDSTTKKTTITFASGDVAVGDEVLVTYQRRVASADVTTITTTGGAARGELTLTWPVMSAGVDCTQAGVVGYLHLKAPRVMVTSRAGMDTSRGSAATPSITFSIIDAHRADEKWYDLIYEPLPDGAISTDYSQEEITWDA